MFTRTQPSLYLRVNRSRFVLRYNKYGRNHFPIFRHPHRWSSHEANALTVAYYWQRFSSHNPTNFLPKSNYITGKWTGKFFLDLSQRYTMQHATCGVPLRMRRYPIQHVFGNASRYMVGKQMICWSRSRPALIDEAALTKGQRAALVKKGIIPK
eukprot:PhM_4_TR2156/c0_g1_i1/m.9325